MSSLSVVTARRVGIYISKESLLTPHQCCRHQIGRGRGGDRFSIFYRRSNKLKCRQTQTNFDATPLQSPYFYLYRASVCLSICRRVFVCIAFISTQTNANTHDGGGGREMQKRRALIGQKRRALGTKGAVRKKLRNHTHNKRERERERD